MGPLPRLTRGPARHALWLALLALALAGCGRSQEPPARQALDPEGVPALQAGLVALYNAPDRAVQAELLGARYRDGAVQLVVDAEGAAWTGDLAWAVAALGGTVEFEVDNLLQAWLPVDALPTLATHPRVVFVRLPVRPR